MASTRAKLLPLTDAEEAEIQREIAANPNAAEATDAELATGRTFAAAFTDLVEGIKRGRGRPRSGRPKEQVTLRLDADVIDKFRATGPGWQVRINDVLKAAKL